MRKFIKDYPTFSTIGLLLILIFIGGLFSSDVIEFFTPIKSDKYAFGSRDPFITMYFFMVVGGLITFIGSFITSIFISSMDDILDFLFDDRLKSFCEYITHNVIFKFKFYLIMFLVVNPIVIVIGLFIQGYGFNIVYVPQTIWFFAYLYGGVSVTTLSILLLGLIIKPIHKSITKEYLKFQCNKYEKRRLKNIKY